MGLRQSVPQATQDQDMEGDDQWSDLPNHIVVKVLSYLEVKDRLSAALTCKAWHECFQTPILWRKITFNFFEKKDERHLKFLDLYGEQLRGVTIVLNQKEEHNRVNACEVINRMARCQERRLEEIVVQFTTDNPLFFKGGEFLNSLAELFGPPAPDAIMHGRLKKVDLSKLSISITDLLLALLADNHPTLEVLNIQNPSLTCHISSTNMLSLVRKCTKLRELSTFYKSISEDVLKAFGEKDRVPLEFLSLACRREEKYHKPISGDAWEQIVAASPKLRVSMKFDHTIERHRISHILHPQIPMAELSMRTMSELHYEMSLVASFYPSTLEVLVIVTKGSDTLKRELINFVTAASKLRVLHCYCGLDEQTIEDVKRLCPTLEDYTLKTAEDFNQMQRVFVGRAARNNAMMWY